MVLCQESLSFTVSLSKAMFRMRSPLLFRDNEQFQTGYLDLAEEHKCRQSSQTVIDCSKTVCM